MTSRLATKRVTSIWKYGTALALMSFIWASVAVAVAAAEPTEIKIGYYESSGGLGVTGKTMEALIKAFAEANPNVKVSSTFAAYSSFFQKLPVELAAGTGPDVWLSDGVLVDQYVAQGFALDLTNHIKNLPNANEFFGLDQNRDPEGHIWAFPQGLQSSAFFYNKDMFEKTGIAYPNDKWSLTDVRKTAMKLTRDNDGNGSTDQYGFRSFNQITEGWAPIIRAFGGGMLDAARKNSRFNDEKTIEALNFMIELLHVDRSSPNTTLPFNWFPQRLVAMQYGLYVRTFAPNQAGVDYDVTVVPTGAAGRSNPVIVNSWIINAQTTLAKQQAAWEWVKYFSGEKAQRVWAELGEAVPVNRKVAVTTFLQLKAAPANRIAFVQGLDYAVPLDPNPVWSNWSTAATNALAPAFKGQVSAREAALNAHQSVQQILDDYYRKGK